jgi:nucleoside-diphosphate-sugar epimerase
MRVAVTGATGFIGGHVVEALCAAGHTARCLVRPTSDTLRIAHLPFERAPGDVLDAAAVAALVAGCDAVIHLALSAGWDQMRTPKQLRRLLVTSERGTRNVLDAARAAGNVRVVFMSSVAVRPTASCSCVCARALTLACAAAHLGSPSTAAARRTACFARTRRPSRWRARWDTPR